MTEEIPPFPEGLTDGTDPIGINPFPEGHPARERWSQATRLAEEAAFKFDAEFLKDVPVDLIDLNAKMATRMLALFDIWTVRYINVIFIEGQLRGFDAWVVKYAEACLSTGKQAFKGPDAMRDASEQYLRRELSAKLSHWKSEARRFLREAQATEPVPSQPPANSDGTGDKTSASAPAPVTTKTGTKTLGGEQFAKWLDAAMRKKALTVRGLGTQSGVDPKTINRLLAGKSSRVRVVEQLCEALGVKIDECPTN